MRITELRPERKSKRKVAVFVDGEFAFSLERKTVKEFGLKPGLAVSPELLEAVVRTEQMHQCQKYALVLLSYRARSEKELRTRLEKKGYTPAVINTVLEEFKEKGWVDDEKLCRRYVHDRITIGHKGRARVKSELLRLGIAPDKIAAALREAPDETTAARMVLEHYLPRYRKLDRTTRRRRLAGLLARRGFSPETIGQVLGTLD